MLQKPANLLGLLTLLRPDAKRHLASMIFMLHSPAVPFVGAKHTIMYMALQQETTLKQFYEAEAAYLAAGGGDFADIAATLDPECVIHQPASLPYGGKWKGHAEFEAWMKAFTQQWSSLEVKNTQLFPYENVIISKSHVYATTRATGKNFDWPLLQFIRFRNSKILAIEPFYWDTAALVSAL